jgi:hypothetical protein
MPVEAAARCDSSLFAWLQPPVLISPAAYWCTSQRPSSSPFPASKTRNPNDDLSRPPRTVAHLAICIQDAHPETAVPSAFFPAANCPPVASALGRSARPLILPLATSYLANCSLMVWENGLCFNRASRIQETSLNTLCWPARTRGLLGVRETVQYHRSPSARHTDTRLQQTSLFSNFQNVNDITTPSTLISSTSRQDGCGLRAASPNSSDPSEQLAWDVKYMELFRTSTNRGALSGGLVNPSTVRAKLTCSNRTSPKRN